MNTRTLGLIAMICSPFLATDFFLNNILPNHFKTSLSGILSMVYMTGWVLSIIALYKLNAMGKSKAGRVVFFIQLLFLTLGECWNVYSIVQPTANTVLFRTLDFFWPISNIFMLATGIVVLRAKQLEGWKRYVPFAVGLWLPLTLVLLPLLFGHTSAVNAITALYSAIAWFTLAYVVFTVSKSNKADRPTTQKPSTIVVTRKSSVAL